MLTNVPHGIVCCNQRVGVDGQREEASVRALAPLQVFISFGQHELRADRICAIRRDVRAEG